MDGEIEKANGGKVEMKEDVKEEVRKEVEMRKEVEQVNEEADREETRTTKTILLRPHIRRFLGKYQMQHTP